MSQQAAASRSSWPGPLGVGLMLIALAVLATQVLRMPIGLSEASALAWVDRFADSAAIGIDSFVRTATTARAAGQPVLAIALAGVLGWLFPAVDTLIVLRLPDALAALLLLGLVYRLAGRGEAGAAAGLWVLAASIASIGWIAPPGWIVAQLAAVMLLAGYRAHIIGHRRSRAWVALIAGLGLLVAEGAGVYAIAVLAGAWLHDGWVRRDWRLLGSHRRTALAALVLAGLTLTPILGVPDLGMLARLYQSLSAPIGYDGLALLVLACVAAWGIFVVPAVRATYQQYRGAAGRHLLILAFAVLVLTMAGTTPAAAATAMAPFIALWLIAPALMPAEDDRRRLLSNLYSLVFMAQAVVLASWSLVAGHGWVEMPVAWGIAVAVVAMVVGAVLAARRQRLGAAGAGVLPVVLSLFALAIAMVGVFDQPRRLTPQRLFDQALAAAIKPLQDRPIAVVAPVNTALWRAELGRPVFTAADPPALCRWVADNGTGQRPLALIQARAVDRIIARLPTAQRELQSPGTPASSVMVVSLGSLSAADCRSMSAR
ncbi:hypothetical protein V5738_11875 [Salinisphaera sp. SPP-AMP-43]|uniref:hypothetical protein n=1 Tax=Salinisphaera sp. SPP-AMP-43 TaxID=3121288 RepID=UPI003C6E7BCB